MVYVFFVQPGDMMTFDNEISIMQSVKDLKEKVQQICGISLDQQVLLINGGEPLDPNKNLCSYMAGTDTNPIYLFSTNFDFSKIEILPNLNFDDSDLKKRLKECCDLPASLATVTKRAQLAQDYHDVAKKQLIFCEGLVHDQHMQQQGWSAVIANLEDIITEFKKRWELFIKMYNAFMADLDTYNTSLQHFEEDKKVLQRIPVLEILLETQKENVPALESSKTSEINTSTSQEVDTSREINLFEWISSDNTKNSLDELHEICKANLQKFEKDVMPSLKKQIEDTLTCAERTDRKEIEGLGKRLFDLEELLRKIRKYVQHQSDMAQSFLQNQNRANNLRDMSILPDLCATHQQQLDYIREHHRKLMEDRSRIIRAKYELCKSLCARICWVQNIEGKLWELDSLLVYYHEHLQRLRKHLEVFQQLHLAPTTYLNAVAEVVRRRMFSQFFLLWASDLACHQLTIHNEEVTRRKEFSAQFEGHFLNTMFPGMSDLPPPFATEAPQMFDAKLPKITEEDIERLKKDLPDLADNLSMPDTTSLANIFMIKSTTKTDKDKVDDTQAVEEKLIQAVSDVGLASNLDQNLLKATGSESCLTTAQGLSHLKDIDKGCESETDTEEFEKVGQSPLELHFEKEIPAVPQPDKHDVSTSTEDNLQISKSEHEKIKSYLVNLNCLAMQATVQLRSELNSLKIQVVNDKGSLSQYCENLSSSWDNLLLDIDNKEKRLVENIKQEHDLEVSSLKYTDEIKNQKIEKLQLEKNNLEVQIRKTYEEINALQIKISTIKEDNIRDVEALRKELQDNELEKQKSLKELTEILKLEHKAEIDNIKSRFKLMTMEKSPSNSSLEKTGDYSSLPSHTFLEQMAENFELDKQKAVNDALAEEKVKWGKEFDEKVKELEIKFEEEKEILTQDIAKRIIEDKDKQIDLLRERERNLNLECIKYKTTIQQLAECETESHSSDLLEQLDNLKRDNEMLQEELEKMKIAKSSELAASVAICDAKVDATTSPIRQKTSELSKSETMLVRPGKLNIDSCKAGDLVLVLWDTVHESFKILQESKHMYFLHSDYLEGLGLSVVDSKPNKLYCCGEVFDKEYCHARKSENRYKVPKGTKFFRVKVKPMSSIPQSVSHPKSAALVQSHMSQSQITSSTCEVILEDASASHSLPSSPTRLNVMLEEQLYEETIPEIRPESVEKNFAEDSGIVENIEQATAAMERLDEETVKNKSDIDRSY